MTIESHDASVDIIGSEPEKWKPETRETADHSLPYITAIAFIDGEVTEKQFQPERFMDPKIWKFLENVKVAAQCGVEPHCIQGGCEHRACRSCTTADG